MSYYFIAQYNSVVIVKLIRRTAKMHKAEFALDDLLKLFRIFVLKRVKYSPTSG